MSEKIKYCTKCKHHERYFPEDYCELPKNMDCATELSSVSCRSERGFFSGLLGGCGPKGIFWEPYTNIHRGGLGPGR